MRCSLVDYRVEADGVPTDVLVLGGLMVALMLLMMMMVSILLLLVIAAVGAVCTGVCADDYHGDFCTGVIVVGGGFSLGCC